MVTFPCLGPLRCRGCNAQSRGTWWQPVRGSLSCLPGLDENSRHPPGMQTIDYVTTVLAPGSSSFCCQCNGCRAELPSPRLKSHNKVWEARTPLLLSLQRGLDELLSAHPPQQSHSLSPCTWGAACLLATAPSPGAEVQVGGGRRAGPAKPPAGLLRSSTDRSLAAVGLC